MPDLWREISKHRQGYRYVEDGVYVFRDINISHELSARASLQQIKFNKPEQSNLILLSYIPLENVGFLNGLTQENWWLMAGLFICMLGISAILTSRYMVESGMYRKIGNLNDELIKSQHSLNLDRKRLTDTVSQLTRRNMQLKEFSQIISHNIRSPISGLTLLTDFLHKDWQNFNDTEKEEVVEKLKHSVSTLNGLTDDLIETVKVLDASDSDSEELSLWTAIDKAKNILMEQIVAFGCDLIIDLGAWDAISYNPLYLDSIILNLMSNSLKYRSPKRALVIKITSELKGGEKILHFEDNGRGINMRWHGANLFGLHKTFHRDTPGKGFGLFMTKTQVESMGGSISAKSEEGVGTHFTITF